MNNKIVNHAIKQFYHIINSPFEYVSLFYVYYYLVNVKGIRELNRRFREIRDELWTAFYNYGIFTINSQLKVIHDSFRITHPYNITDCLKHTYDRSKIYNSDFKFLSYVMYPHYSNFPSTKTIRTFRDVVDRVAISEKALCIFSQPERFLRCAAHLFGLTSDTTGGKCSWKEEWIGEYGGEPWANISRNILKRNKLTKTMFVDSCWNLVHNDVTWLAKGGDFFMEIPDLTERANMHKIHSLLDANFEGNMQLLFKEAEKYEPWLAEYEV